MYIVEKGSFFITLKSRPIDIWQGIKEVSQCQGEIYKLLKDSQLVHNIKENVIYDDFSLLSQIYHFEKDEYLPINVFNPISFNLTIPNDILKEDLYEINIPKKYNVIYNGIFFLAYVEIEYKSKIFIFGHLIRDTLKKIFEKSDYVESFIIPPSRARGIIICNGDEINTNNTFFKIPENMNIENFLLSSLLHNTKFLLLLYQIFAHIQYLNVSVPIRNKIIMDILSKEQECSELNFWNILKKRKINKNIDSLLNQLITIDVKYNDIFQKYEEGNAALNEELLDYNKKSNLIPITKIILENHKTDLKHSIIYDNPQIFNYLHQQRITMKNLNAVLLGTLIGAFITLLGAILSSIIQKFLLTSV